MTVQEVLDNLPVFVKVVQPGSDLVLTCRVTGRLQSWATVTPVETEWANCSWEFSWEAVARAVSDGKPLTV